jgi:thiosulfate/3-mercaptopyruvate sulfurtransferase
MTYYRVMSIRTIFAGIAFLAFALAADFPTVEPKDLASQLQAKNAKATLIHVGFPVMYRGKHIPASIYAGPGSKQEGLDALKAAVANLPRSQDIVLYCGCCPFDKCPNVRPAVALLKQMGFTSVKVLDIPTNFGADWVDHGYPVEEGLAAK